MKSSNFKNLVFLLFGIFTAGMTWEILLFFVKDKPVPNAVFNQSIIDAKLDSKVLKFETPKVLLSVVRMFFLELILNNFLNQQVFYQ